MGLDSYIFRETPGDTRFELPAPLTGGMFSNHGFDGSFRGKVYEPLIHAASSGELTLYESDQGSDWLAEVEYALDYYLSKIGDDTSTVVIPYPWDDESETYSIEEIRALRDLFHQAAEKNCRYAGWW